jgi:hypothetical protein
MRALPRLWAAAALLVWALWPMKLAAAPVLPGHWQGQIAGQTIALTLQADGGGLLDGQPIRYQAMGSNLLIERQGSVTVYVFELRGGMLLALRLRRRKHRRFDARAEVQLGQDVAHVQLDGVVADVQRAGDRLVAFATGQVVQDLALALGQ